CTGCVVCTSFALTRCTYAPHTQIYTLSLHDALPISRRSLHPTVQAAREEHELIASHGGAAGIAKLREDSQFVKSAFTQFSKGDRSEEHTSELQSRSDIVCRLLLEKKKNKRSSITQRS